MKKICIIIGLFISPCAMATVLQPDYAYNDLVLKQQSEVKQFTDQLDKKYAAVLVKRDLLERDNNYVKAKANLYAQYRKRVHEGPQAFDHDLELLKEQYSPGLTAGLQSYSTELAEGKQHIANKYAQMRKALKNS